MSEQEKLSARKKILIVDDSEMNRSLLSDILCSEYDILEAENGMEASAILHSHEQEIAVMLLDIVMPVMDGFEMLDVMNKNGWIKSIPVIMISAEAASAYVDRAYDLGVNDYISRPFDERTVRRRVINTIMLSAKQKELVNMVTEQIVEKERDNKIMVEILSNIVEFRNGESGLHVLHIRTLTDLILRRLLEKTDKYKISKKDIPLICNASALHDIGKISIPSKILNKPGRLTPEEYEIMKTHSAEGARMLKDIPMREQEPLIEMGYRICRWHHERYDGRGYPDGLKGEEIPIAAQIVALADVYDALTSKRVYKDAYSHETAVDMILNGECGTFNPLLLECLQDISATLKTEFASLVVEKNKEIEMMDTVEQIMERGELDVSERTLKLLEHERMKSRFYADMSREIQFEYTVTPEMMILSEWGAAYLGMPETIINPRGEDFGKKIFGGDDFEILLTRTKNAPESSPVIEGTYLLNINGQERWSKVITRSIWEGETPEYTGAIGKIVDINDDLEKINRLEKLASRDSLTGILNHRAAKARINTILARGKQEKDYILCMFDLDKFKMANDNYGHLFGDEVLKHVAETLVECTRSADIIARMGGDEFLIFMEYKKDVEPQVSRIFQQLCGQYKDFPIRVSMGVGRAKDCGGDYERLFHMADVAMYVVKQNGRNGYRIYSEEMEAALNETSEGK